MCLSPGTESGTRLAMVELVLEVLTRHNSGLALEWLSAFARRAAPDDAQFALYGVLSQCGPPYSATYAAAVLELMAAAQVRVSEGHRLSGAMAPRLRKASASTWSVCGTPATLMGSLTRLFPRRDPRIAQKAAPGGCC